MQPYSACAVLNFDPALQPDEGLSTLQLGTCVQPNGGFLVILIMALHGLLSAEWSCTSLWAR